MEAPGPFDHESLVSIPTKGSVTRLRQTCSTIRWQPDVAFAYSGRLTDDGGPTLAGMTLTVA